MHFFSLSVGFFRILGQVWYLIVSIPDLCTLTYFKENWLTFLGIWGEAELFLGIW